MAKKKQRKATQTQDADSTATAVETPAGDEQATASEPASKMSLVREAIGELGGDSKPATLAEYIQTRHNVTIPATMISSYKSSILRGNDASNRSTTGRGRKNDGNVAVSIADVEEVRQILERLGATQFERLVAALS
jgi:hypothetical protein